MTNGKQSITKYGKSSLLTVDYFEIRARTSSTERIHSYTGVPAFAFMSYILDGQPFWIRCILDILKIRDEIIILLD